MTEYKYSVIIWDPTTGNNLEPWDLPLRRGSALFLDGCRVQFILVRLFSTFLFVAATLGLTTPQAQAASGCTSASHYGVGDSYHGRTTASGETYNAYGNSVAHRWLPFGTKLRVTNQSNGKSVIVRVNDRGPYAGNRDLDLSYGAFSRISNPGNGVVRVCYTTV